ncbi:MAG: glutathione peroxidase [Bacteroidota bacterium]
MKRVREILILVMAGLPILLSAQTSLHDFTVKDINGLDYKLSQLKGKKVLVVNTASKCGLTPQYEDLEKLYRMYKDSGLVVIGFPSNDFAGQEPGTNEEIATFCKEKYEVSFPMMSKIHVKGDEIHPLYRWLTTEAENGVEESKIAWNFQKYMIDENGVMVGHVAPRKKPDSKEIISWLTE